MNSKTDQVQAHRFMMGRLSSALLRVDPDAPESPLHRTYRGSTIGGLIATLVCLGLLVFGLISPGGNTSWKVEGALVVSDTTGARFLYAGGKLLPVLNLASARLVAGDRLVVKHVADASLREVPRGEALGIIGAPDALPAAAADPWEVCAAVGRDQAGSTALRIGGGSGRALGPDDAVVVVTPDGVTSLLWQGRRHRVATNRGALDALDGMPQPVKAPAALLDALPVGPDFAPRTLAGLGAPGPALGAVDSRIGRLFAVAGEPSQRYVLTGTGLAPISELEARLLTADPELRRAAYGGGEVLVTPLPGRLVSENLAKAEPPPPVKPPRATTLHSGQSLCALVTPDGGTPRTQLTVSDQVAAVGAPPLAQPGIAPPCARVDRITVRPGTGALVKATAASGRLGDALYLVTDTGVKYPVPPEGAKALGYGATAAIGLSTSLLALLPTGAALDPAVLRGGGTVLPAATACTS
ncbi:MULTISPECIES: type VII secretion protein EccB [unclassified Crossiella]|uniref:type VII secretion protein EccB n=1 Tax=unclassified Crossiella TaxID=2620835 RepID=UPI001FFF28CA|nr:MULTISPECIES: type VII secretion protein EccB [unclassified Crossiella]MCK2239949.1 type VII secretion protein EccB [Crossiella sp. S99.2]MCK2252657.1 type VII secretion protein EccB [Crossiella sp. S99.1]